MLRLLNADIIRDGGSLFVEYQREDASRVFVLLEVAGLPRSGEPREFRHLHVANTVPHMRSASNSCKGFFSGARITC